MMDIVKQSHWQQVNIRDGIPCCPCCDEPMAQVSDTEWRCTLDLAIEQRMRELMDHG
jgi:hypothetical protein